MKRIFENLVNGNLKEAKHGARRFSGAKLEAFARDELNWPAIRCIRAAQWLKGHCDFQAYCDAA